MNIFLPGSCCARSFLLLETIQWQQGNGLCGLSLARRTVWCIRALLVDPFWMCTGRGVCRWHCQLGSYLLNLRVQIMTIENCGFFFNCLVCRSNRVLTDENLCFWRWGKVISRCPHLRICVSVILSHTWCDQRIEHKRANDKLAASVFSLWYYIDIFVAVARGRQAAHQKLGSKAFMLWVYAWLSLVQSSQPTDFATPCRFWSKIRFVYQSKRMRISKEKRINYLIDLNIFIRDRDHLIWAIANLFTAHHIHKVKWAVALLFRMY